MAIGLSISKRLDEITSNNLIGMSTLSENLELLTGKTQHRNLKLVVDTSLEESKVPEGSPKQRMVNTTIYVVDANGRAIEKMTPAQVTALDASVWEQQNFHTNKVNPYSNIGGMTTVVRQINP
jgi:hypothetical protein